MHESIAIAFDFRRPLGTPRARIDPRRYMIDAMFLKYLLKKREAVSEDPHLGCERKHDIDEFVGSGR
jgi:hypothetical protein